MKKTQVGQGIECALGAVRCVAQEAAPGSDVCRDLNDGSAHAVSRVKKALEGGNDICRCLSQERT